MRKLPHAWLTSLSQLFEGPTRRVSTAVLPPPPRTAPAGPPPRPPSSPDGEDHDPDCDGCCSDNPLDGIGTYPEGEMLALLYLDPRANIPNGALPWSVRADAHYEGPDSLLFLRSGSPRLQVAKELCYAIRWFARNEDQPE